MYPFSMRCSLSKNLHYYAAQTYAPFNLINFKLPHRTELQGHVLKIDYDIDLMSRWKTRNHSHWVSFQYSKVKLDSNTYNVGIVLYITHTQQRVRASDKLARWLRSAAMQLRRLRLPAMCTIICEAGWGYWTLDMFRLTNLIVLIRLTFCADMGTNLRVGC